MLEAEQRLPVRLTENYMISPAEAICGFSAERGSYFSVGTVSAPALADYALRRGLPASTLAPLINRF